jgi:hypothetical protein
MLYMCSKKCICVDVVHVFLEVCNLDKKKIIVIFLLYCHFSPNENFEIKKITTIYLT